MSFDPIAANVMAQRQRADSWRPPDVQPSPVIQLPDAHAGGTTVRVIDAGDLNAPIAGAVTYVGDGGGTTVRDTRDDRTLDHDGQPTTPEPRSTV